MKKKIELKDLKVQSFVTSLDNDERQTVKGGAKITDDNRICNQTSLTPTCQTACFVCGGATQAPNC
ncbi:MAG: hypothetical protein ACJATA_000962 [Sphingobacteriales bacterium]|jgi:hypothetical protein